jgi:hypothetical protein
VSLAESFREAMESLSRETRELRDIVGPPVVEAAVPLTRTAADRGRTVTAVAIWVAAAAALVIGTIGVADIWFQADSQPVAATPTPLISRHVAAGGLMGVVPPRIANGVPYIVWEPQAREPRAPTSAAAPSGPPAADRTTVVMPVPAPIAAPVAPAPIPAPDPPAPAAPAPSAVVAPSVRAQIVEHHDRWFAAFGAGDAARLAELEADGFRMLDMRPPADRVSRSGAMERSVERVTIDISGDALVLAGRLVERVADGSDVRTVVSTISEVWTASGTDWRLLGIVIRPAAAP